MFKSRINYIVLALLFGSLGLHDFYARRHFFGIYLLGSFLALIVFSEIIPVINLLFLCNIIFIVYEIFSVRYDGTGKQFSEFITK